MPSFRYTAIGPGGEIQRGLMDAATEAEVITRLQRQGSMPMRAEPAAGGSALASLMHIDLGGKSGLKKQEVADFVREHPLSGEEEPAEAAELAAVEA